MVTIIKNQLLKHLSRFTKNLSPEQISLSALRGSGELQDLTLDEDLLTDLLELPGWVRLTSARCNKASFRIQWTKLKTVPIVLSMDEVHIALEVCEEPRTMNQAAAAALPVPGKYSYIHKVIDGISVSVNQVQVDFRCDAFTSSVQISRVTVESRTPEGRKGDLRLTRLKSPDTGQLLIFKNEEDWETYRQTRCNVLKSEGKDPTKHNFKPEWIAFWTTRLKQLHEDMQVNMLEICRKLCLSPPDMTRSEPQPKTQRPTSYHNRLKLAEKKAKAAEESAKETLAYHEENPEKHPLYPEEWVKFRSRRYAEMEAEGKDPSEHDLLPEWFVFWTTRMNQLHEEEMRVNVLEIYRKLCLSPPDMTRREPQPKTQESESESEEAEEEAAEEEAAEEEEAEEEPLDLSVRTIWTKQGRDYATQLVSSQLPAGQ